MARNIGPAFSLVPRRDLEDKTMNSLRRFFRENPDAELQVTMTINKANFKDYVKGNRISLANYRGFPRVA